MTVHIQDNDLGDPKLTKTRAWTQINGLIADYRNATCVQLGNGVSTLLWKDKWTINGPLCVQFPALFSHTTRPNVSVADCWQNGGWNIPLNHITSDRAENERVALMNFLASCTLDQEKVDKRGWRLNMGDEFSVKNMYSLMNWGGVEHITASTVWKCAAPKKGKMFAWLLIKGRIKVRSILRKQQIVEDDNCPFGCRAAETVRHFVLECTRMKQILAALGIHLDTVSELEDIFGAARQQCPEEKEKA